MSFKPPGIFSWRLFILCSVLSPQNKYLESIRACVSLEVRSQPEPVCVEHFKFTAAGGSCMGTGDKRLPCCSSRCGVSRWVTDGAAVPASAPSCSGRHTQCVRQPRRRGSGDKLRALISAQGRIASGSDTGVYFHSVPFLKQLGCEFAPTLKKRGCSCLS